ncbi:MAG: hypothetical protein IIZ27_04550 [Solobacterium sp.]|nr:hypothetical protein [Solobacterium sp.]
MKVLFVGNSHTFFNDMPALFARFAEITTGETTDAVMLAYSGRELEWHRKEYFSLRYQLMYGKYDYCVIQQAAHPFPSKESTMTMGKEIIDLCHRTHTKPVVYMTWAEKRFPENQQKMIDTLTELAETNNALICPVGIIWQRILQEYPEIDLFWKDGEHAGVYGDFLIAASFCRLLTGKVSPEVSGLGQDFFGDSTFNFELPRILEDPEKVKIDLDKEKTDTILKVIESVFSQTE